MSESLTRIRPIVFAVLCLIAGIGAALFSACKPSEDKTHKKVYRKTPPSVTPGRVTWYEKHTPEQEQIEVRRVAEQLDKVIKVLDRKDLNGLLKLVSKKRGLWIDLKTHRSYARLLREIEKPDGYLRKFYLDTKLLRQYKGDDDSLSVRDVLRHTDTVKFDFYMEAGARECELRLYLVDYPAFNYQLNHPIFIKEDGVWKIYRLF